MVKRVGVGVKKYGRKNAQTKWDRFFGGSYTGQSLTSFWRGEWTREERLRKNNGELDEKLLAKYLREARNTVKIVFGGRVTVNWATEDENYTNIQTGYIALSPYPLLSEKPVHEPFTMDQRLDVLHGVALHEAAHNTYTPQNVRSRTVRQGGELLAQLFNLIEDGYIEAEVMADFPGFAGYFDAFPNFYLNKEELLARKQAFREKDFTPYDPDEPEEVVEAIEQLSVLVNLVIAACKTRQELDLSDVEGVSERHDHGLRVVNDIVNLYRLCEHAGTPINERIDAAKVAYAKLCAFLQPPENEEKQGSGGDGAVITIESFAGNFAGSAIAEAFAKGGVSAASGTSEISIEQMPGSDEDEEGGNDTITSEQAQRVTGLLDAGLRQQSVETFHTSSSGNTDYDVNIVDMPAMPYARERYRSMRRDIRPNIVRLKNKLRFRSSSVFYRERERQSGRVDPSRLPNLVAFKQREIFEQKIEAEAPAVHLGLLVDESGSMASHAGGGNRKDVVAAECAIMIVEAIKDEKTVSYEVWGHSGDSGGSYWGRTAGKAKTDDNGKMLVEDLTRESYGPIPGVTFEGPYLMRYMDSKQGLVDPAVLGRLIARANNYDGFAIGGVHKNMRSNAPDSRRVLLVINDGMPAGHQYGDPVTHTERHIRKARKEGTEVIGIFVGDLGHSRDQMVKMYGPENKGWVHCRRSDDLPKAMERISRQILKWERKV